MNNDVRVAVHVVGILNSLILVWGQLGKTSRNIKEMRKYSQAFTIPGGGKF